MEINDFLEKTEKFDHLMQKEQVKLIAFFYCISKKKQLFSGQEIVQEFKNHSLKPPANINRELKKLEKTKPPILISSKNGFSFHRTSNIELGKIFLKEVHKRDVSQTLRDLLEIFTGEEQRNFLEEAISCFEIKSFRASIIMTWLLTMDVIYEYTLRTENLELFNKAIQSHGKYRKINISKKDDFSNIKEADFIELLRVAKLISNDSRKILDEKLGVRNSCAHPNSIKILDYKAINFIQDLVVNVIRKLQ